MKKTGLLLFFLFFTYHLFAQSTGYVITVHNDTLKCAKVKHSFIGDLPRYKVKSSDDFKTVNIDSIREYMFSSDSLAYRSVITEGQKKPQFLRVLENGKICLYEDIETVTTTNGSSTSTLNWYVSKNNAPAFFLKTTGLNLFGKNQDARKQLLTDALSDNPSVLAMYKTDDSFSRKKLRKYIHDYNEMALQGK